MIISNRFIVEVQAHLAGNYLQIEKYPVILAIFGPSGMGKTYQLRFILESLNVEVFSVNSSDLESQYAGLPAKILKEQYLNASYNIAEGKPSALVIDDIDTTVGEWEKNTGTVNHQSILAFLMHIADNPCYIETIGKIERVPIFVTGNRFDLLYEPLRRPGRTRLFYWSPTYEEKLIILGEIFYNQKIAKAALSVYPDHSIAFFSDLFSYQCSAELSSLVNNDILKKILSHKDFREKKKTEYQDIMKSIDWIKFFKGKGNKIEDYN